MYTLACATAVDRRNYSDDTRSPSSTASYRLMQTPVHSHRCRRVRRRSQNLSTSPALGHRMPHGSVRSRTFPDHKAYGRLELSRYRHTAVNWQYRRPRSSCKHHPAEDKLLCHRDCVDRSRRMTKLLLLTPVPQKREYLF